MSGMDHCVETLDLLIVIDNTMSKQGAKRRQRRLLRKCVHDHNLELQGNAYGNHGLHIRYIFLRIHVSL